MKNSTSVRSVVSTHPDRHPSWNFSDAECQAHARWFWRCPIRLVTGGLWAHLWDSPGRLTSILPVLALHMSPAREWDCLSTIRTALVGGVDKNTVVEGVRALNVRGLLKTPRAARGGRYGGSEPRRFRLTAELFPADEDEDESDEYRSIRGSLFYSGIWSVLPAACRHLYVVLSCLDPIRDEQAYLNRILEDNCDNWEHVAAAMVASGDLSDDLLRAFLSRGIDDAGESAIKAAVLAQRRGPLSVTELVKLSGMSRRAVIRALQLLTKPLGKIPPLIKSGHAGRNGGRWFAPNADALTWRYSTNALNDRARVKAIRAKVKVGSENAA